MNFWIDISLLMLNTLLLGFINPFFWLVVVIVFMQYRRAVNMEKKLFGQPINSVWKQTFYSIFYGLIGGLFGSVFLLFLCISLESIGIVYLWPVAILLFLFNPRFLCFAYAGGIVAVVALALRVLHPVLPFLENIGILSGLLNIHLPSLLTLVGILHLTEALLIYMSGHKGASPIYLKTAEGDVVGGYSMQRFWPLPLMGLWAMVVAETSSAFVGSIPMPEWWPLLGTVMSPGGGERILYMMLPLVAGLGYSDLAVSSRPNDKRVKSARYLALYSILLTILAVSAVFWSFMIIPAALMAPLGHELLIKQGNREEFSRAPLFSPTDQGVIVMAVVPGSPAAQAGLQEGDQVKAVNRVPVHSEQHFLELLRLHYQQVLLTVQRQDRELPLPAKLYPVPVSHFGAVFAPGRMPRVYVEMKHSPVWKRWGRRSPSA